MSRWSLRLLDLGIVAVLLGAVVAFVWLRADQHRWDDEARSVARWAQTEGVSRVAWPVEARGAVPVLEAEGLSVVLIDPSTVATQNAVVNDTPILASSDPSDFVALGLDADASHVAGSMHAVLVDVNEASQVPVEVGRAVGQQFSRPLVYAPISPARAITVEDPFVTDLLLAPGEYVWEVAMHHPTELGVRDPASAGGRFTASTGTAVLMSEERPLAPLVVEPFSTRFVVPHGPTVVVHLAVEIVAPPPDPDDPPVTGYVHAWTLGRPR